MKEIDAVEYQTIDNLSQTIDNSTDKYPCNNAVKTAIDSIDLSPYQTTANLSQTLDTSTTKYPCNNAVKTAVDAKQATITGGASTITSSNLTASRALVSNSSGKVAVSEVTSTELGYLDGVTSAIQTQLNAKQATISGGASTIATSNLTANRALISNGSGKVEVSAVTSTELGYLDGVTSNVQTQLNGKQASGSYMTLSGNQTASGNKTFSGQIIRSTAPSASDNSTQVPNTSWVNSRITSVMDSGRVLNYASGTTVDFPLSSSKFTAPSQGVYMVNAKWGGDNNGVRAYVNDVEIASGGNSQSGSAYVDNGSCAYIPLDKGDVLYFSSACRAVRLSRFYTYKN